MRTKCILGLLICIAFIYSLSFAQPANAASAEEEVLKVATNFAKAMNNADFELMSSLYWHSPNVSMFISPKSMPFLIQGWEGIEANWKHILNEYPKGTFNISLHNLQATILTKDIGLLTGYDILNVNPPASITQYTMQERFTYVLKKIEGNWLIVNQHVSVLPTE